MPGKEEPFIEFVRWHWERLHRVARQYSSSHLDGQDLVQETLLRAWKSYSALSQRPPSASWMFIIMRNIALEWQRGSSSKLWLKVDSDTELTELFAPDLGEPYAGLSSFSEKGFREFLDDKIAAAFDDLEAPFKEVLLLSVAGGLNYREISEILGCPMGTVMSRMARARRHMRERLAHLAGFKRISQEARR